jgi:hypothetical protein
LEGLAEERYHALAYHNVKWIDPSVPTTSSVDDDPSIDDEEDTITIPIYPIPAVYLPYGKHVLNNVEPRNLQMALDLNATKSSTSTGKTDPTLFCVTLAAADTGRIATVGTLLQIEDMVPTYDPLDPSKLIRMTVHCQAKGVVEIETIVHPVTSQQKLLQSSTYLQGRVRILTPSPSTDDVKPPKRLLHQMNEDFQLLRTMYNLGIGSQDLPPKALVNLALAMPQDLLLISDDDDDDDDGKDHKNGIWQAAQIWQSLCLTIREGKEQLLQSDRNEWMVAASTSTQGGGPLRLPIHLEDLSIQERRRVQDLEVQAQTDFVALELDPCLDFLALMSLDTDHERWNWLATMISRERLRTEQAARQYISSSGEEEEKDEPFAMKEQPRPGAWFNDELW